MNIDGTIANQAKNLHAGSLMTGFGAVVLLLGQHNAVYFLIAGVAWSIFFWTRQFKLREKLQRRAVRNFQQIFAQALLRRASSYVVYLPLICTCLILYGYLAGGERGLMVSLGPAAVYALLALLAERYPIEEHA